jgi:hypothetical protein
MHNELINRHVTIARYSDERIVEQIRSVMIRNDDIIDGIGITLHGFMVLIE